MLATRGRREANGTAPSNPPTTSNGAPNALRPPNTIPPRYSPAPHDRADQEPDHGGDDGQDDDGERRGDEPLHLGPLLLGGLHPLLLGHLLLASQHGLAGLLGGQRRSRDNGQDDHQDREEGGQSPAEAGTFLEVAEGTAGVRNDPQRSRGKPCFWEVGASFSFNSPPLIDSLRSVEDPCVACCIPTRYLCQGGNGRVVTGWAG